MIQKILCWLGFHTSEWVMAGYYKCTACGDESCGW
jgi:hypothetical protein